MYMCMCAHTHAYVYTWPSPTAMYVVGATVVAIAMYYRSTATPCVALCCAACRAVAWAGSAKQHDLSCVERFASAGLYLARYLSCPTTNPRIKSTE